jgi:hypothetical protein
MKKAKDSVAAVVVGDEVGLMIDQQKTEVHFEKGDQVLCYELRMDTQTTDWQPYGFTL